MADTKIEWADKSWNPVTGCTAVGLGCENCYARRMAQRLRGRYGYPEDKPFKPTCYPNRIKEPLHWYKAACIFVVSMGDLFHPDIPDAFIRDVLDTIDICGVEAEHSGKCAHRFMLLTKRPERMVRVISDWCASYLKEGVAAHISKMMIGISASNQELYDRRVQVLLESDLRIRRFVSLEPLLGQIDMHESLSSYPRRRWPSLVIVGGESGPKARPMHPDWPVLIRGQCAARLIHFHFKQWGEWAWWEQQPHAKDKVWSPDYKKLAAHRQCYVSWYGEITDHTHPNSMHMVRLGKHAAGRLLESRLHDSPGLSAELT